MNEEEYTCQRCGKYQGIHGINVNRKTKERVCSECLGLESKVTIIQR